jgi:hypothetical protein
MADVRVPYAGGFTTAPNTRVPYAPAQGGFTAKPSAFAQMSNVPGTGNLNSPNIWKDPENLFYKFAFATEPLAKAQAYQNLNRALNSTAGPAGFKNQFDYISSLLVKTGLTKNSLGFASALDKVVAASVGTNTDPFTFLETYQKSLAGDKPVKQPDTTTRYAKQIQTAMQFKDLGDARQYYNDAYFTAFGKNPSADLDKKFQDAWNMQVRDQEKPTTTKTTTEKAPIYDKKAKPLIDKATGEQKKDKFGNPIYVDKSGKPAIAKDKNGVYRYTDVITGTSTSGGEGFTPEEQKQFLADFLVANNPNTEWSVDDLGGSAKSLYDTIASFHKANYSKVPDLPSLSTLINNVLSSTDEKVATEYITQYQNTVRKQTANKFMSLSEEIKAGEDADKYVKPLLEVFTTALEKNFTQDDPFVIQALNFKDDKGVYRMPNALELNQMIMNHPDYGKTAKAVNEAVDLTQNLRSKLGRG